MEMIIRKIICFMVFITTFGFVLSKTTPIITSLGVWNVFFVPGVIGIGVLWIWFLIWLFGIPLDEL